MGCNDYHGSDYESAVGQLSTLGGTSRTIARILAIIFALVLIVALFGGLGVFAVYDYGLICTRCFYYEHHAQLRLFDMTLWSWTEGGGGLDKYGEVYQDIFQHPCNHVQKTGGFGYRYGCGMTAEGMLFDGRNKALRSLFEAYKRVGDRKLATNCFAIIEQLMPEKTTVQSYYHYDLGSQGAVRPDLSLLFELADYLDKVKAPGEWTEVNRYAKQEFSTIPPFTQNEQALPPSSTHHRQ